MITDVLLFIFDSTFVVVRGESGKEFNLEYEDDQNNHEEILSSLFDTKFNLTERHLESPSLTTKQDMKHNIAVVDSGDYEDNQQDTNISKSYSYAGSDEDEMKENPEPESPDPDYVYFGEISLTDLYSMPGFRKDLHDEIADQGYCPPCMLLNPIYVNTRSFFQMGTS